MTAREIIDKIARDSLVEEIAHNISNDEAVEDLCQDIYIDLFTKDPALIEKMYAEGSLKYYITKMLLNNIYSNTSRFWTTYKKWRLNREPIENHLT